MSGCVEGFAAGATPFLDVTKPVTSNPYLALCEVASDRIRQEGGGEEDAVRLWDRAGGCITA